MTKYLIILLLTGCAAIGISPDIPEKVVDWAQSNTVKVSVERVIGYGAGTGSGFWVNDEYILSACHVVEGANVIKVTDNAETYNLDVEVIVCDEDLDIALLRYNGETIKGIQNILILDSIPRPGTALYGPGYPLGGSLVITRGDWMSTEAIGPGYIVSLVTILGDSGGAAVYYKDGRVVLVGMRVSLQYIRQGPLGRINYYITHLVVVKSSPTILKFLESNDVSVETV